MMKIFWKSALIGLALAGLAACGGAHAATNDLIANNVAGNPAADGRVYSFATAKYITQDSASQFTITNADNTTQAIADSGGVKFAALKNWSGFGLTWLQATNYSGQAVYANVGAGKYATCSAGNLTIGFTTTTFNLTDGTGCAAFNALKAAAN